MKMRWTRWIACAALCGVALACSKSEDDTTGTDPVVPGDGPGTAGNPAVDPGVDDPMVDDPMVDDPMVDDPMVDDPMVDDPMDPMPTSYPDPRGGCPELNTRFPGDEACIQPPAAGEGMQIHIGPTNHDDEAEVAQFILGAGDETSACWKYHTPNDTMVNYQGYVFSGRPGTHHVFNSMLVEANQDGGGFTVCVDGGLGEGAGRLGGLPGAGRAYFERMVVAPENAGVAGEIPPNVQAEADMHYFNYTDDDILREFWMNIYFIDPSKVTDTVKIIRGMGGLSWTAIPIPANADMVYSYECPLNATGRIISMQGHFHSHGVRESAWIRRGDGSRVPVFEMFDYAEQASYQFDSITENPEFTGSSDFGYTGILEVSPGDVLEWECHIKNGSTPLRYTNSVENGEMCNIFGGFIGDKEIPNCLEF